MKTILVAFLPKEGAVASKKAKTYAYNTTDEVAEENVIKIDKWKQKLQVVKVLDPPMLFVNTVSGELTDELVVGEMQAVIQDVKVLEIIS